MERIDQTPPDATVANASLWAHYFEQEWKRWLNPLGLPVAEPVAQFAETTGARIASFLTLVAAGPIARLYSENAPHVTPIRPAPPADDSASADPAAA